MSFNSDIDLSLFKLATKETLNEINKEFFKKYDKIPEEFNWSKVLLNDSESMIRKKSLMSTVKNQYLCGCCWAISCATAISDAYVVNDLVTWSPNVSYTYALSKYPQQKCVGGSARVLLEDIKKGDGISSDYCVDESWCLNDDRCLARDSSKHFQNNDKTYLSSLIPPEGCYDGTKKHYVYFVDDTYSLTVCETLKVNELQTKIKQHIMVRGPVVGGFLIMKNFPDGKFTTSEDGVYYERDNKDRSKEGCLVDVDKDTIIGSHSVVIVGWGVSNVTKIPYWYCRNSWGENWGERGYFKIAMYPFNKICQFTKKIKIIHDGVIKEVGGVTGFKVSRKPELRLLKSNNVSYNKLKNSKILYTIDENVALDIAEEERQQQRIFKNFVIVASIAITMYFMFKFRIL